MDTPTRLGRIGITLAALLAAPLNAGADAPAAVPTVGSIAWADGFADAQTQARASHRLILIDFYTDWCPWCHRLDDVTFQDPDVIAQLHRVVPVQLNAEQGGAALAAKYNVQGYPTVLLVGADGQVVKTIVGYEDPQKFAADVQAAIARRAPQ